jgi:hypothetical protein
VAIDFQIRDLHFIKMFGLQLLNHSKTWLYFMRKIPYMVELKVLFQLEVLHVSSFTITKVAVLFCINNVNVAVVDVTS